MSFQLSLFAPKPTAMPAQAVVDAVEQAAGAALRENAAHETPNVTKSIPGAGGIPGVTLDYCVLGSGSGGNSAVVRYGQQAVLVDAGFGPRRTASWLSNAGVQLADVRAICLTHLDQDHFRPQWIPTLVGFRIRVHIHQWHLPDLERTPGANDLLDAGLVHVFDGESFDPIDDVRVSCVHLPHDHKGTVGFVLAAGGTRIGHATDLGHVPPGLIASFAGVDLLAIESNYDHELQLSSARPAFLKKRIMGGKGHLSNDQAFDAVRRIDRASPTGLPRHIVLLHRSRECNSPNHVDRVFSADASIAARVTLTQQRRRTKWFKLAPLERVAREQMPLGFRY